VRGETFDQIICRLRQGNADAARQYTRRKLLSAFSTACLAVHFAHTRGVLHRDLKPSNVILGDFGEVYVLDWGIAKVVGVSEERPSGESADARELEPAHTVEGETIGTLGFMPPEQARGELGELDARSDVYALGAVLFELLTLEPLHPGTTKAALLASTIEGADARATARAPEQDVPPELETICVRATQSDPEARYRTVRELSDAVERYLDGDRDIERRKALANEHALRAARLAEQAWRRDVGQSGARSLQKRRQALNEIGHALAFDADNREARDAFKLLLTVPPAAVPPEAEQEVARTMTEDGRTGTRSAAAAVFLALLVMVPTVLLAGIKSWSAVGLLCGIVLLGGVLTARAAARPDPSGKLPVSISVIALLTGATSAIFCGPYVLAPTVMACLGSLLMLVPDGGLRPATLVATAALAELLPLALEWVGIVPPSTRFDDGAITILPRTLALHPLATQAFLILVNFFFLVAPMLVIGRVRAMLWKAQREARIHAWHLSQLVPPEGSR
jgi:hypothetical protein